MPPSRLVSVLRWNPVAISCSIVAFGQQIAGQLLDGELVVRHVAVERVDHPVAVAPCLRPRRGPSHSRRYRRNGPGPASGAPTSRRSAARRAAVHQRAHRRRADVGQEVVDLGGGWRQAVRSRLSAADQRGLRGLGRRLDLLGFQPRQDELVDRIARPLRVANGGRGGPADRLERPVDGR